MAPRVTRAAARAAATVEICVDEIDVLHVIDVEDEVVTGANDEVEEDGRKVLEVVTGNMVESAVGEAVEAEEKTGGKKKKKKNGTKRGKRKSRGVVVQEPEQQQDVEDVEVATDVPVPAGVEDPEEADVGANVDPSTTSVVEQNELPTPEVETPTAPVEECPATPAQARPATPMQEISATPVQELPSTPVQERPDTPVEECPATSDQDGSSTPAQERPATPVKERPSTPVKETDEEDYLPDYEYASPMRVLDQNPMDGADLMTTQHISEDNTEEPTQQVGSLMKDGTIPNLQNSMAQLSLQNEYKLASEDEEELNHDTPPQRTPMALRAIDLNELHNSTFHDDVDASHTYTPRHNITESADLCIPDYDVGTVFGVVAIQQDDARMVEEEPVQHAQVDTHGSDGESTNAAQRFEALFQEMATESASTGVATITDILDRVPELPGSTGTVTQVETIQAPINDVESNGEPSLDAQVTEVPQESVTDKSHVLAASVASTTQTSQVKQRSAIAALHTPPRPVKSNKAATKSTFQLPGEAIAAKLKAQREERKKKEESNQDLRTRKDVAAPSRPVLKSARTTGSIVTTSRAKSSVQSDTLKSGSSTVTSRPVVDRNARPSMPARGTSTATRTTSSRPLHTGASTLTARTKPSTSAYEPLKKSAPILSRPAPPRTSTSTAPLRPSLAPRNTAPSHPSSTADPTARVHATGADVFNRPMVRRALEEKAAKEKVEAQKRARAEAAERSRAMSREFAERKRGGVCGKGVGVGGGGRRDVSGVGGAVAGSVEVVGGGGGGAVVVEGVVEVS